MGSALAFWAYQRNLGIQPENADSAHQADAEQRKNSLEKGRPRSKRTESESSAVSWHPDTVDRRGSNNSAAEFTDDEALEHPQHTKEKPKGQRRFSLDFLFSRKAKDKKAKEKSKRSQSVAVPSDGYIEDPHLGEFRCGSEFALAM